MTQAASHSAPPPSHAEPANTNSTSVLADIQDILQLRYDVSVPFCVNQFVCHNASHLKQVSGDNSNSPEMLFYREDGDNLDISLYIDATLLNKVEAHVLQSDWTGELFNDCCMLLEGVSHFLYLSWNAHYDRQVSLLDLELQAEVDKYIFAALNTETRDGQYLLERLYRQVSYREALTPKLQKRYQTANELALIYCTWLQENFVDSVTRERSCRGKLANRKFAAELARFYRLNGTAKQQHIKNCLH